MSQSTKFLIYGNYLDEHLIEGRNVFNLLPVLTHFIFVAIMKIIIPIVFILLFGSDSFSQSKRARDYGIKIGVFKTGELNAITDVEGVKVGHTTLIIGDSIRTGVTAILPHTDNIFRLKVPAAIYIGNGYGKLTGYSQVKELGNIETPII